jgi:4-hydroxy-4-methyl-2-oxoglutarate aldolase
MGDVGSHLRSALVCDALDSVGLRSQCLPPEIRPLCSDHILVGRAFTVAVERVKEVPDERYRGLLRALDALGPGDVYVVSSGSSRDVALWGELLSVAAQTRGALGAVCDGFIRDSALVRRLRFPVFARGAVPLDIHGRLEVTNFGDPLDIAGVSVCSGDLLVADDDGVVVVPRDVEQIVVDIALSKSSEEAAFREAVAEGIPASKAYEMYGVL